MMMMMMMTKMETTNNEQILRHAIQIKILFIFKILQKYFFH